MNLKYVENQTDEICLAAVREYGLALEHVENQTQEICLAAITQEPKANQFVKLKLSELVIKLIEISTTIDVGINADIIFIDNDGNKYFIDSMHSAAGEGLIYLKQSKL